jgi:tetratricopeptide (TPR) repeat protein
MHQGYLPGLRLELYNESMPNTVKHVGFAGASFPSDVHRISLVQIGAKLDAWLPTGVLSKIQVGESYERKLQQALTLSLAEHWANVVVFPEISIPIGSIPGLLELSCQEVEQRNSSACDALVCLPLEHIAYEDLAGLIQRLERIPHCDAGDPECRSATALEYLFEPIPPAQRATGFTNVALILLITRQSSAIEVKYLLQPKRFPYEEERTPRVGQFARGRFTYLLRIGRTTVATALCYDLIAQLPHQGGALACLMRHLRENGFQPDYLLLPQCNQAPLDHAFQHAVADLYRQAEADSQSLRVVSPNMAYIDVRNRRLNAGHSWFTTCPFGRELPPIGKWERSLPSEIEDPIGRFFIRDMPALGHYAHRLRLSARGEWLLNLSLPPIATLASSQDPNFPVVPHAGQVYEWKDDNWLEMPPTQFTKECSVAEGLPGLCTLVEAPRWIKENTVDQSPYSPTYEEYVNGKVRVPGCVANELSSLLENSQCGWVHGGPGCGKTVFGLATALEWISQGRGISLFYDFRVLDKDQESFVTDVLADLAWACGSSDGTVLLVIDNVHMAEGATMQLVRGVMALRAETKEAALVLLGRSNLDGLPTRTSLERTGLVVPIELAATPEAFMSVARRLRSRAGLTGADDEELAARWHTQCGGDLAVFVAGFDPDSPRELDAPSISRQVRDRYIRRASEPHGNLDAFLELCVLSSLDLRADAASLWNRSPEALFPDLVSGGAVTRAPSQRRNPREYWQLFHPSLGQLVLGVHTGFSSSGLRALWLEIALSLCSRVPFLLSWFQDRVTSQHYKTPISQISWLNALRGTDHLIERAVCASPYATVVAFREVSGVWSWDDLEALPAIDGYDALCENLAQTQANDVVTFLKYLKKAGRPEEASTLLEELLEDDQFCASLAQTQANDVVTFLKYLKKAGRPEEASTLLEKLLGDDQFCASLARTPADLVVTFLKYLEKAGRPEEASTFLEKLLGDDQFADFLVRSPLNQVGNLLGFAVSSGKYSSAKQMLSWLLASEEWYDRQNTQPLDQCASALTALFQSGAQDLVVCLFEATWGQLDLRSARERVEGRPRHTIAAVVSCIRNCRLRLPSDIWDLLIRTAIGESYKPVEPDLEYPQEQLLDMPLLELIALMESTERDDGRYKMNCIFASLTSDEQALRAYLVNRSERERVELRNAIETLRVNLAPELWTILAPDDSETTPHRNPP